MRNLLSRAPKRAQGLVGTLVRSIFVQPTSKEVWAQHERVVAELGHCFPAAAAMLGEVAKDVLAFRAFPQSVWRQIRPNNPQGQLNWEIRRRANVVGIFPTRAAIIRLIGALLGEYNDEWMVSRRYMSVGVLQKAQQTDTEDGDQQLGEACEERVLVEQLVG
jgi:putative transposase